MGEAQATEGLWTDQVIVDLVRYQLAHAQGDVEEMQRIEQQDHFGEVLAAEAEFAKTGSMRTMNFGGSSKAAASSKNMLAGVAARSKLKAAAKFAAIGAGANLGAVAEDEEAAPEPPPMRTMPVKKQMTKMQLLGDLFTGVGDKDPAVDRTAMSRKRLDI